MKLVFDTSILIDALRLHKNARDVLARVEQTDHELFLPSIVGFKLFSGESSRKEDQVRKIKELLTFFDIVELNWDIAKVAGEIFREVNKNMQVPDYIVAATTLNIGASLVTLNRKHFEIIPGLALYSF